MRVDLNCDMGESYGAWTMGHDAAMMKYISSANIAGGFHAGDPQIMRKTVHLAAEHGVAIGIHAGFPDLVGFGRRYMRVTPEEIQNDLIYQLGALREFGKVYGLGVQHVKPHGALYMMAADDADLSRAIVEAIQKVDPSLVLYCMQASKTYEVAKAMGQPVAAEFYADREYNADGKIVFTRKVDSSLDPAQVAERVYRAVHDKKVTTFDGLDIDIEVDSICVHGDTPGAVELAQAIAEYLTNVQGIEIARISN
ncbi:MAG: LamB/YcsF family protein [Bacilli bacterium]